MSNYVIFLGSLRKESTNRQLAEAFIHHLPEGDTAVVFERLVNFKVIAPAGQLQAVEAPLADLPGNIFEGHIRPLAGKESDRSCHDVILLLFDGC